MNPEKEIVEYLRQVNPRAFEVSDDPAPLLLRRILDSLDMADFLAFLEQRFQLRIRDQDVLARHFETVGSVVAFVGARLEQMRALRETASAEDP